MSSGGDGTHRDDKRPSSLSHDEVDRLLGRAEMAETECATLRQALAAAEKRAKGLYDKADRYRSEGAQFESALATANHKLRELLEIRNRDVELQQANKSAICSNKDMWEAINERDAIKATCEAEIVRLKNIIVSQAEQLAERGPNA